MDRRRAPPTDEGWYMLHDMRRIRWDQWRGLPEDDREYRLEEGVDQLASIEAVDDAPTGQSAFFVGLGHEVDLLGIHLRPELGHLDAIERRLDRGAIGALTDRTDSYLSVTEVSGYLINEYFDEDASTDPGMENYIESRLHPTIPDVEAVSFYPMSKRRGETDNWYDLPFEERAQHMDAHGEIGKGYAGQVQQIISGSIGFADWEWGVTLFAEEPTTIKDLLYEMRFDPSTSRFAEFGSFTVGRRLAPDALPALLAGDPIGASAESATSADDHHHHASGTDDEAAEDVRTALDAAGVYAGQPHGEDVHALVLYSEADPETVAEEVADLRGNFEHYDTHVDTGVYEADDLGAIVSIWETADAADTAAGFLSELPGVHDRDDGGDGWETMGMFYQVKPEHREAFVETFEEVGHELAEMEGHRETTLFTRIDDPCDMFISSRWDAQEDAMAFFGSDEFRETVQWGRDVLAGRPRHVFLA